jgi:CRISPR-associated protein Cas1
MRIKDYHELPKVRDSLSFVYIEHGKIDREDKAIAVHDEMGLTPVPCASLNLLMLGPGTRITHAAIETLSDCGCLVVWCGEQGVRFYACGMGETRSSSRLLHQVHLVERMSTRLQVVRRMYSMRFKEQPDDKLTLRQIRGMEGARVRDAYYNASQETGVKWEGRNYDRSNWSSADPVNRALSSGNSCLYGICHAAIIAAGYSPAIGFIHTGKMLSFVYDIADLYKMDIVVPVAFRMAAAGMGELERRIRIALRDEFVKQRLLPRIVDDIDHVLDIKPENVESEEMDFDADPAQPGYLWDPEEKNIEGGQNLSEESQESGG